MKTIIFLCTSLVLFLTATSDAQYNWTDIQYHFQTGSVPPPYYHEYDIYISAAGTGSLAYHTGYGNDSTSKNFTYDLTLSPEDIASLDEAIQKSKVLTATFEEMEKHPIGGSMNNVFVTLPQDPRLDHKPPRIEIPYFPKSKKQKAALEKLYEAVRSLVPQSIWDDIDSKCGK